MMDANVAWIAPTLSGIASLFVLLASIGVLRMPDLYSRIQASSKAAPLGATLALIGCSVHFGSAAVILRAIGLIVFLVLTAPLAAHLIGRAGYISGAELEPGAIIDDAALEYRDRARAAIDDDRRQVTTSPPRSGAPADH